MLVVEALEHALEELFEGVVGVLGPSDNMIQQILPELILAICRVAFIQNANELVLAALVIDLKLDGWRCQEVVEDHQGLRHQIWITNRHEQIVLQLAEDLEPVLCVGC